MSIMGLDILRMKYKANIPPQGKTSAVNNPKVTEGKNNKKANTLNTMFLHA